MRLPKDFVFLSALSALPLYISAEVSKTLALIQNIFAFLEKERIYRLFQLIM